MSGAFADGTCTSSNFRAIVADLAVYNMGATSRGPRRTTVTQPSKHCAKRMRPLAHVARLAASGACALVVSISDFGKLSRSPKRNTSNDGASALKAQDSRPRAEGSATFARFRPTSGEFALSMASDLHRELGMKRATGRRVLVAVRSSRHARSLARRFAAAGDDVAVVHNIEQTSRLLGNFDHAVLGFDFRDGSGIVLAASLFAEGRLKSFEFVHPETEAAAEHAHGARAELASMVA